MAFLRLALKLYLVESTVYIMFLYTVGPIRAAYYVHYMANLIVELHSELFRGSFLNQKF